MTVLADEVAEEVAESMLESLPELSPYQKTVAYGITQDKAVAWRQADRQGGVVVPIQINYRQSKGS